MVDDQNPPKVSNSSAPSVPNTLVTIVLGIAAVLAAAVLLLIHQRDERAAELMTQYRRMIEHRASQIEAKYASDQRVVESAARTFETRDASAKTPRDRHRAIEEASQQARLTAERLAGAADAMLRAPQCESDFLPADLRSLEREATTIADTLIPDAVCFPNPRELEQRNAEFREHVARLEFNERAAVRPDHALLNEEQLFNYLAHAVSTIDRGVSANLSWDDQTQQAVGWWRRASYRRIAQRCSAHENLPLCIARDVARSAGASGSEVEIDTCASVASNPVRRGGPYVTFRVSDTDSDTSDSGSADGLCGLVPLKALMTHQGDKADGQLGESSVGSFEFDGLLLVDNAEGRLLIANGLSPPGEEELKRVLAQIRDAGPIAIGATPYRSFVRPLNVYVCAPGPERAGEDRADRPACSGTDQLQLIGLVREDPLEQWRLSLSAVPTLWAILLVSLAVLSLPMVKLWIAGPRARFRRFDVELLATAAVASAFLSAVVALGLVGHRRMMERVDTETAQVAERLAAALRRKFSDMAVTLAAFDDMSQSLRVALVAAARGDGEGVSSGVSDVASDTLEQECANLAHPQWRYGGITNHARRADRSHKPTACVVSQFEQPQRNAEWRTAFWMNRRGEQQIKVFHGADASPLIVLDDRHYFTASLKDEQVRLGPQATHVGVPEIVRSATSGKIVAIVARPTRGPNGEVDGVAAVEGTLRAFERPVLPLGFQMAIFDESGKIMLHSENDAHHGQSIFGDVREQKELRALVTTGEPQNMTVHYLGSQVRARVAPVPGTGWSVMVVAPLSIVDAVTTHSVWVTIVGVSILISTMLALALLWVSLLQWRPNTQQARRDTLRERITPRRDHAHAYAREGIWTTWVAALLCLLALLTTSYAFTLILCSAWFGAVALFITSPAPAHSVDAPKRSERWRDSLTLAYTLRWSGLVGVFVLAPAAILFTRIFDHAVDNVARAEQYHFAREFRHEPACLTELPSASTASVAGSQISGAGERHLTCDRLFAGVAQRWVPGPPRRAEPKEHANRLLTIGCLIDRWLPLQCSDVPSLGRLSLAACGQHLQSGSATSAEPLVPHAWKRVGQSVEMPINQGRLTAVLPRLLEGSDNSKWFYLACALLVLLAISSLVINRSLRRLLLLDVRYSRASVRAHHQTADSLRNTLIPAAAPAGSSERPLDATRSPSALPEEAAAPNEAGIYAMSLAIGVRQGTAEAGAFLAALAPAPHVEMSSATRPRRPDKQRLVVVGASERLVVELTNHPAFAVYGATDNSESKDDPNIVWFVPDLEALVTRRDAACLTGAPARLILLSRTEPLRLIDRVCRDDEKRRQAWLTELQDFELRSNIESDSGLTKPTSDFAPQTNRALLERWWSDSDTDERRILAQLVIDGFLNPNPLNRPLVLDLILRGLLDPYTLLIVNDDFAQFISEKVGTAQLRKWESAGHGDLWTLVRAPLTTGVGVLLAILSTSRPELAVPGFLLTPAVIPSLWKLLTSPKS
jgi:hypothetical protein